VRTYRPARRRQDTTPQMPGRRRAHLPWPSTAAAAVTMGVRCGATAQPRSIRAMCTCGTLGWKRPRFIAHGQLCGHHCGARCNRGLHCAALPATAIRTGRCISECWHPINT
jgi:hypothetical protein